MNPVLETGKIKKRKPGAAEEDVTYEIRLIGEEYLPRVLALQDLVVSRLTREDLLEPFPPDFMKSHFGYKGLVFGVLCGEDLAAFRNIYFPDSKDREWNLGIDLDLPPVSLPQIANLQMVCVHPIYRGNSLAWKMNQHAIRAIQAFGRYRFLCATVSPYNFWNVKVLLKSGFVIRKLKEKYGGKLRYIVFQDLEQPLQFSQRTEQRIRLADLNKQQSLLDQGYCGIGFKTQKSLSSAKTQELMDDVELVFALQAAT